MKKFLFALITGGMLFTSLSCKKAIEKKERQMLMDAITNGVWIVEQYYEGATNISNQFLNYTFQFYSNGTVTGIIDSTATNGTWSANVSNYSITSEFPSAGDPLKKLNGLWIIKDSDWNYVKAEMTTSTGTNILTLRKK